MAIIRENLHIPAIDSSPSDIDTYLGRRELTSLEYNRIIRDWPEAVFNRWASEEQLIGWLSPRATIDFRSGGIYLLSWGKLGQVAGEYVEIIPGRRIRFTWCDRVSPLTLVSVEIRGYGTKTHLRLLHQLFGGATKSQWNEGHLNEWAFFLDNLQSVVEFGKDLRPAKAEEDGWEWLLGQFFSPEPSSKDI